MKREFSDYLNSIGIIGELFEKIEKIYDFYSEINSEEIEDILVTEYITEDGSREYMSVWFFTDNFAMEANNFTNKDKDDFDCVGIKNTIVRWEIIKQDYDFQEITEKSRFNLEIKFASGTKGYFKSSKQNCNHLKHIFLKYIVPNLK